MKPVIQRLKLIHLLPLLVVGVPAGAGQGITAKFREPTQIQMYKYAERFYPPDDDPNAGTADGPATWKQIEKDGWPVALANFKTQFKPGKSYIALYEKLPLSPLDMRSADRFKKSMSPDAVWGKSSIGHMTVGWSCAASPSHPRSEGFTGSTGEDDDQSDVMAKAGWGITSFLSVYTDGHLQTGSEIQGYFSSEVVDAIDDHRRIPTMFPLVVEVPSAECEQVRSFIKDYLYHPDKPYTRFSLALDPLDFSGAGCGSFAISALSLSQTLNGLTSSFWRTIAIPERLFGRLTLDQLPEHVEPVTFAKDLSRIRNINPIKFMAMDWDYGYSSYQLHFVDPELSIFALRRLAEQTASDSQNVSKYQQQHIKHLKRIFYFPARNSTAGDFGDDVDYDTQEINEDFHSSYANVTAAVKELNGALAAKNYKSDLVNFAFGVGVMIQQQEGPQK